MIKTETLLSNFLGVFKQNDKTYIITKYHGGTLPPIEIVYKTSLVGTMKHALKDVDKYNTRRAIRPRIDNGLKISLGPKINYEDDIGAFVRFDWRNKLPFKDECIPNDFANMYIDVDNAKRTCLLVSEYIDTFLKESGYTLVDTCYFMDQEGEMIFSEITPDGMRIKKLSDGTSHDKDLWRAGADKNEVVKIWEKLYADLTKEEEIVEDRVGVMIGRFQPPTKSHSDGIEYMMSHYKNSVILVGSANKFNERNPFTIHHRMNMLDMIVADIHHQDTLKKFHKTKGNIDIIPLDDVTDETDNDNKDFGDTIYEKIKLLYGDNVKIDIISADTEKMKEWFRDELKTNINLIQRERVDEIHASKIREFLDGLKFQAFDSSDIKDLLAPALIRSKTIADIAKDYHRYTMKNK